MDDRNPKGKIPDTILAFVTQLVLGIALATSATPPTVLSLQDRGCETIGVFVVLIVTAACALPLRAAFGIWDLDRSEYLLAVLAPFVARIDLALLIWVSVNKALLWAEPMLYATHEELQCIRLLVLASTVWHDGENRLFDPEFGYYGGEAATVMYKLLRDYNPRNATGTVLPFFGHITLYPFAIMFHALLQVIAALGFIPFWFLAVLARFSASSTTKNALIARGSFWHFLMRRRSAHSRKLFLKKEVAAVFDANQRLLTAPSRLVRYRWAMLGNVDSIIQHPHFAKVLNACYPMRAPQILQRAHRDPVCNDVMKIRNIEDILFSNHQDQPIVGVGEPASKQIILYRVMVWPEHSEYSRQCLERLEQFAEKNFNAWKDTEARLADKKGQLSEFISVRHILRRVLVQLIILGWCDGLGECRNSDVSDVPAELASWFLKASLQGIEMLVRLCNLPSEWNDIHQMSSMITALSSNLGACSCTICSEMASARRITAARYESKPSGEQLAEQLHRAGCDNALAIENVWKSAVLQWTRILYGVEQGQEIVSLPPSDR